jgi:hypothetical protein
MTRSQTEVLAQIRETMLDGGRYEIKQEIINDIGYFISYALEVGLPNDEGTLASLICNTYKLFFIGKRGGVTLRHTNSNGKFSSKEIVGLHKALQYSL